jgi:hypothetical protein
MSALAFPLGFLTSLDKWSASREACTGTGQLNTDKEQATMP